ncbi:hypothetical protein FJV83_13755 [Mesorhizobium sp. WSM4307]|uniref:hypothetical protein n=1 Tax=unclassified Mesorhizobium TaxID=325217 RepID=UPI00115CC2CF|nr:MULTISPECIES: hypothetical protein [unclassified Mesorhizobium]TRC75077.1 hypothetical protein FJV81_19570 [Mesorhizobium sp. WSM4315]TRC84763.1 hypothetical protein FJV83_13755 [Mesorhizobium sp. WSM4307]
MTLWFVDLLWREYHAARGEPTESQALKASLISREIAPRCRERRIEDEIIGYAQAGAVASRTSRAICLDMMQPPVTGRAANAGLETKKSEQPLTFQLLEALPPQSGRGIEAFWNDAPRP